jgi:hypothetical protein
VSVGNTITAPFLTAEAHFVICTRLEHSNILASTYEISPFPSIRIPMPRNNAQEFYEILTRLGDISYDIWGDGCLSQKFLQTIDSSSEIAA